MRSIQRYGLLVAGLLVLGGALIGGAVALPALAHGNSGAVHTPLAGYGYGEMMGGGMMGGGYAGSGPGGMMGGAAAGSGPGGMMGGSPGTAASPTAQRLSGPQVRQAINAYLNASYGGQNLTIAEILEFQHNFYARIQEPATGINALELLINPYSGALGPEYGPNMMWNTKYGHMAVGTGGIMGGGMMGRGMMGQGWMGGSAPPQTPTADMPVTAAQAVQAAQQYLQAQGSAWTVESQPDRFYGYYTFETLQDGQTAGMLSVNGYTGQVWAHTWHGAFLGVVSSGD